MELKTCLVLALIAAIPLVHAEVTKCYKCDSTKDDRKCVNEPEKAETCETEGVCFVKQKDDGEVSRGCFEQLDDIKKCGQQNHCKSCANNNCNVDKEYEASLNCYVCDGDSCSGELDAKLLKKCTNVVPFGEKEKCFVKTIKNDDKTTYKRGCFNDLSADDKKECDNCLTCGDDSCNKGEPAKPDTTTKKPDTSENTTKETEKPVVTETPKLEDFKCIVCRSDRANEKACAFKKIEGDALKAFSRKCDSPLIETDPKACYIQRLENNVVIRDCISTAKILNLNINADACNIDKDKDTKCNYCEGENCNTGEPRNSGAHIKIYGSLIALAAVFVTKYL